MNMLDWIANHFLIGSEAYTTGRNTDKKKPMVREVISNRGKPIHNVLLN